MESSHLFFPSHLSLGLGEWVSTHTPLLPVFLIIPWLTLLIDKHIDTYPHAHPSMTFPQLKPKQRSPALLFSLYEMHPPVPECLSVCGWQVFHGGRVKVERTKTMGSTAEGKCTLFKIRVKWYWSPIICGAGRESALLLSHHSRIDSWVWREGLKSYGALYCCSQSKQLTTKLQDKLNYRTNLSLFLTVLQFCLLNEAGKMMLEPNKNNVFSKWRQLLIRYSSHNEKCRADNGDDWKAW